MNRLLLILLCLLCLGPVAGKNFSSADHRSLLQNLQDTLIGEDTTKEDQLIEEVIKSKTAPAKEKVAYFNQVSRFGFKDLFSNYDYDATLPYDAQINPNAALFVQDYMKVHGNYLQTMKGWGQPYFNLIETVLKQYGLPKELKYIAVIESNLSSGATSVVGAGGPWQFMPFTARNYGLVVNSYQDERRDYYKSTHAAAKYLLALYAQLHDWLLVMAAYNGGPGRVYSAMKKSGSKNFWDLQYYLPSESRTYVKRFIATHYIMEGSGGVTTRGAGSPGLNNSIGIQNTSPHADGHLASQPAASETAAVRESLPNDVQSLAISGKYNSLIIARTLSMDIGLFNRYNPNFDGIMSATGNFELRLPADKMQLFITNKYPILNESVQLLLNGASFPVNNLTSPKTKDKKKS